VLTLRNVFAGRGGLRALHGVSLHVRDGTIVTLIGSNGAGKTTLLETIAGLLRPEDGWIRLDGTDIHGDEPEAIVRRGIALVPEGRQLFTPLSVRDNLLLGAYPRPRREVAGAMDEVFRLFPALAERKEQLAGTLSGGEQQMLAIGRALMARPRILLLDEPSMGLAPRLTAEIFHSLRALAGRGVTILLVEQNARLALEVAERGYVLETGRIVVEGTSEELLRDHGVKRAYLGRGAGEPWDAPPPEGGG